ncbi:hypothetical protein D3C76_928130 [compost metagenome]
MDYSCSTKYGADRNDDFYYSAYIHATSYCSLLLLKKRGVAAITDLRIEFSPYTRNAHQAWPMELIGPVMTFLIDNS